MTGPDLDLALGDLRTRLRQLRTAEPARASYRRWARFLYDEIGFSIAANTVRAYELGEHEIPARYVLAVALATRRDPFWLMRDVPAAELRPESRERRVAIVAEALQSVADRLRSGELPIEALAPGPARGLPGGGYAPPARREPAEEQWSLPLAGAAGAGSERRGSTA
jgi:hypothetical protein